MTMILFFFMQVSSMIQRLKFVPKTTSMVRIPPRFFWSFIVGISIPTMFLQCALPYEIRLMSFLMRFMFILDYSAPCWHQWQYHTIVSNILPLWHWWQPFLFEIFLFLLLINFLSLWHKWQRGYFFAPPVTMLPVTMCSFSSHMIFMVLVRFVNFSEFLSNVRFVNYSEFLSNIFKSTLGKGFVNMSTICSLVSTYTILTTF